MFSSKMRCIYPRDQTKFPPPKHLYRFKKNIYLHKRTRLILMVSQAIAYLGNQKKKKKKKISFHVPMGSWLNMHYFSYRLSFQIFSFSAFKTECVYCFLSYLLLVEERRITRSYTKVSWVHKIGKIWSKPVEPDSPSEDRTWTSLYH